MVALDERLHERADKRRSNGASLVEVVFERVEHQQDVALPVHVEQHLDQGFMVGIQGGPRSLIDDLGSA